MLWMNEHGGMQGCPQGILMSQVVQTILEGDFKANFWVNGGGGEGFCIKQIWDNSKS